MQCLSSQKFSPRCIDGGKEKALIEFLESCTKDDFTKESSTTYPYLPRQRLGCDLKVKEKENVPFLWIEIKDNVTLLPIGVSKIIYDMDKLVFLDIARLMVGVNNETDYRVIVASVDKKLVSDYYCLDPNQVIEETFSAEDILPVSYNRKQFVEIRLDARLKINYIEFDSYYLMVGRIIGGWVSISIYKNLEDKRMEGECQRILFFEPHISKKKKNFFQKYFPSS